MSLLPILRVVACLMGAAGVIAAAMAAHVSGDARVAAAAQMLLVHAAAVLALTTGLPSRALLAATAALAAGACLFGLDMAVRGFADHAVFPMAAPAGGLLMIAAWLACGVVFVTARHSTRQVG